MYACVYCVRGLDNQHSKKWRIRVVHHMYVLSIQVFIIYRLLVGIDSNINLTSPLATDIMPLTRDFRWLIWLIALRRSAAAFFFADAWRARAARAARAPAETAGMPSSLSSWWWDGPPSRSSRSRSRNRSTCSSAGVRATSVGQRRWIWYLASLW